MKKTRNNLGVKIFFAVALPNFVLAPAGLFIPFPYFLLFAPAMGMYTSFAIEWAIRGYDIPNSQIKDLK